MSFDGDRQQCVHHCKFTQYRNIFFTIIICVTCLVPDLVIGKDVTDTDKQYTIPENCDFSSVGEVFMDNECTPTIISDDYTGFVINLPKEHLYGLEEKILFGGFTFLPVCGVYRLSNGSLPGDRIENDILLVAVNTKTKEVYSGRYHAPGVEADVPDEFIVAKKEIKPGAFIGGGYFNYNLAAVVGLPKKTAEYIVYVTAGTFKSNVRVVKVIEKK